MKPGLLAALLRDTHVVAERAVRLKELLPHTNVSAMVAKQPELLLQVMLASVSTFCGVLVDQMHAHGFDLSIRVWAFVHGTNPPTCHDSNSNGHGDFGVLGRSFHGSFVAVSSSMHSQSLMTQLWHLFKA